MSGIVAAPCELGWYMRRGSRQSAGVDDPKRVWNAAKAEAAAGHDRLPKLPADQRRAVVGAEEPLARRRVALRPADRRHVVPVEQEALLGVDDVRALLHL